MSQKAGQDDKKCGTKVSKSGNKITVNPMKTEPTHNGNMFLTLKFL